MGFGKFTCPRCGRRISKAGFARASHKRKHDREDIARELANAQEALRHD